MQGFVKKYISHPVTGDVAELGIRRVAQLYWLAAGGWRFRIFRRRKIEVKYCPNN